MAINEEPKDKGPDNQEHLEEALHLRVLLYELLEFTRSRQLRERVAGLSFGDMIQQAIEAIDSTKKDEDVASNPLGVQRLGQLQELDHLETAAKKTFDAVKKLLDTSSETLYDTEAYQQILEGELGEEFKDFEKSLDGNGGVGIG